MKLLLTSSGITNASINDAMVSLLGQPIAESRALVVPTGIYPFPGGMDHAARMIRGEGNSHFCELGWKTLGVLELTALPNISRDVWVPMVEETDVLFVWGGDVMFLSYWMHHTGLTQLVPTLRETVYVGVSAGSMAATTTAVEACTGPPTGTCTPLWSEEVVWPSPDGDISRIVIAVEGAGFVDFSVIAHLDNKNHPDASLANAERWAAKIPAATYAIDDETAIQVVEGKVDVISEGHWKLFTP